MTTANEGISTDATSLKVKLPAQIKLGKVTANPLPLAAIVQELVMFPTWVLNAVRWGLLSICRVATVFKLIPLRVFKKVLLMVTLCALETVEPKLRPDKFGRPTKEIAFTAVNRPNWRLDRRVRSVKLNVPPI